MIVIPIHKKMLVPVLNVLCCLNFIKNKVYSRKHPVIIANTCPNDTLTYLNNFILTENSLNKTAYPLSQWFPTGEEFLPGRNSTLL